MAASKSNSSKLGPFDDRRISKSRFVVLRRFLGLVLILFIVENPLSQSAVETGRVRAILASREILGYKEENESSLDTAVMT